jgi:hypothetical protein
MTSGKRRAGDPAAADSRVCDDGVLLGVYGCPHAPATAGSSIGATSYRSIASILKTGLDKRSWRDVCQVKNGIGTDHA